MAGASLHNGRPYRVQVRRLVHVVLASTFLVGLLAYVTVPVGSSAYLPGILCAIVAIFSIGKVYRELSGTFLIPTMFVLAIVFASLCFTTIDPEIAGVRLLGEGQLIYSLWIAFTGYVLVKRLGVSDARSVCITLLLLVLLGCVLELTTSFVDVVNRVRNLIYPPFDVAGADSIRARYLFGGPRPNLFASEPSHLAMFIVLLLTGWWALSRSRKEKLLNVLVMLSLILIVRSPVVMVCPLLYFLVELYRSRRSVLNNILNLRVLTIFVGLVLVLLVSFTVPQMRQRFDLIARGADNSFNTRIVAPVYYTGSVLAASPLFGTGIRGTRSQESKELYSRGLEAAHVDIGRIDQATTVTDIDVMINNDFWLFWTEYGLLGGTLLLAVIAILLRGELGKPLVPLFLIVVLLSQAMGGLYSVRFLATIWVMFAFLAIMRRDSASKCHGSATAFPRWIAPIMAPTEQVSDV